ncbi:hypothetical protein BDV25DRAFT_139423 [Aspergillus avenaceus]|uniref:Transaldolase n=1 Tax=Aspergillus avenaceus TaxID=36643 RepID=A0A5N6TX05_ASPAV|nr:hypothetical protein BDV25DRAFT_139423 [Aspergillus avenaceus]
MGSTTVPTWLDKLEEQLNVDVDWMDPAFTKSLPIVPNDMTSNQLWVNEQMNHPDNVELFNNAVKEYKEQGWLAIYTRIACLMCKENIGNIKGRVLLQVLPSNAYDGQKVLEHARMYAREFEKVGISKDRFCIKIPSTGPALSVCPILREEGIATLGTALFSLPQAIAASQAGCLYISPYYNEVRAHDDLSLWPDVDDPATQHTMSARIIQMLETYRRLFETTGKEQPLIKNASFISVKEAMAAGEMGCHSATISPQALTELAKLPYDGSKQPGQGIPKPTHPNHQNSVPTPVRLKEVAKTDPLAAAHWDGQLASTEIDYLDNNGAELERAIKSDPITVIRLKDALELFIGGENKSRAKIEDALKQFA